MPGMVTLFMFITLWLVTFGWLAAHREA